MSLAVFYFAVMVPYMMGFAIGGMKRLGIWSTYLSVFAWLSGGIIPTLLNAASGRLDDIGEVPASVWIFVMCWWTLVAFIGFVAGRFMVWLYERTLPECSDRSQYLNGCLNLRVRGVPNCYDTIKNGKCPSGKEVA